MAFWALGLQGIRCTGRCNMLALFTSHENMSVPEDYHALSLGRLVNSAETRHMLAMSHKHHASIRAQSASKLGTLVYTIPGPPILRSSRNASIHDTDLGIGGLQIAVAFAFLELLQLQRLLAPAPPIQMQGVDATAAILLSLLLSR